MLKYLLTTSSRERAIDDDALCFRIQDKSCNQVPGLVAALHSVADNVNKFHSGIELYYQWVIQTRHDTYVG
jgi:hypothetical protein